MNQTAVMIVENKVEAEAIALFDGELTFREFMDNINKHFNQAKQMEKQQIIEARQDGHESTYNTCESGCMGREILETSNEQYYNETFKSE